MTETSLRATDEHKKQMEKYGKQEFVMSIMIYYIRAFALKSPFSSRWKVSASHGHALQFSGSLLTT